MISSFVRSAAMQHVMSTSMRAMATAANQSVQKVRGNAIC